MQASEQAQHSSTAPRVSIIMPCFNECAYIEQSVMSLVSQKLAPGWTSEILIADGRSEDGTRDKLAALSQRFAQIEIIDNERRVTPAALELLLGRARGEYIVRADAHAEYPEDYVRTLVEHLESTGAANVGGVWDTCPGDTSVRARVIASCLSSRFGVGVSYRNRLGSEPVEVETVPFGAWRASHFEEYGRFDPAFTRAQDLEHSLRIRKMGGRVLCLPWLRIRYYARSTLGQLWRMSLQYGYWKVPVRRKHGGAFSLRQYIPPLLVLTTLLAVALAPFEPLLLLALAPYLAVSLLVSLRKAIRDRSPASLPWYLLCFHAMHYGYGIGYFRGYWDVYVSRRIQFHEISR